jgi:Xaa-Pro aminopeptidase
MFFRSMAWRSPGVAAVERRPGAPCGRDDSLRAVLGARHDAQHRAGRRNVEAAWRKVIRRAGYDKASRIGYSIGLNYPPDWGKRTASLREGDQRVLEPNMCFHMILGMWMDDWGCELCQTFCVRERGSPEILTSLPRDPVIKP